MVRFALSGTENLRLISKWNLGDAFTGLDREKLYPTISLKKSSDEIKTNFGQEAFIYNIGDAMEVCAIRALRPSHICRHSRMT